MSNEIQTAPHAQMQRPKSVRQQVADAFASVEMQSALAVVPPWIDRETFAAQAAADAADPALSGVPLPELVRGYLTIARMGVMPGPCRHVARVPRGNTLDVQMQWQGLDYLFRQGGWQVSAHLVVEGDEFEIAAIGPDEFTVVRHSYADPFARVVLPPSGKPQRQPGEIRGGYACGTNLRTGETIYRFVSLERLERARKAAKTQNIWTQDYAQMASKTVYHQAASRRWFPLAADVQAALTLAEELDLPPASAHTAQLPAVVPQQLKTVRLPSLPQVQTQPEAHAVDVDFADPEEAANV
jgi:hypothetical protein